MTNRFVLDSSFLIDYERGEDAARRFLESHPDATYFIPSVVYGEVLLGAALGGARITEVQQGLEWAEILPVIDTTMLRAAEVASAAQERGVRLDGVDAFVAGCTVEHGATLVSRDSDHVDAADAGVLEIATYGGEV